MKLQLSRDAIYRLTKIQTSLQLVIAKLLIISYFKGDDFYRVTSAVSLVPTKNLK